MDLVGSEVVDGAEGGGGKNFFSQYFFPFCGLLPVVFLWCFFGVFFWSFPNPQTPLVADFRIR